MDNKSYFEIYDKKPLMDKVTALGESIERMNAAELHGVEIRWRKGSSEDAEYYREEYRAQVERVNHLYDAIRADLRGMLRKLHEAGGCGASEEWSKGWDAAITEAINVVSDAVGISIEEAIE